MVFRNFNKGKSLKNMKINLSLFSLEGLFAGFVTDIDLTPSGLARKQVAGIVNWWLKNTMVMQEVA